MGGKGKAEPSSQPTWEDVSYAMKGLDDDLGLHTHIRIAPLPDNQIEVTCFVFREVEGVRLGICKTLGLFPCARHQRVEGLAILLVHEAYWQADMLAHLAPSMGRTRRS